MWPYFFSDVAFWIFGTIAGGSFAKASLCNTWAFGCKWDSRILFSLGRLQLIFFEFWALRLYFQAYAKKERKQQQRSSYRSFIWSETPRKNIVAIGLSTLKDIVLFPIGSLRNVFVESYILNLLLILCIYLNLNDVFFFQILHMIMRPLMVTKKMAIANDSPSKWQKN